MLKTTIARCHKLTTIACSVFLSFLLSCGFALAADTEKTSTDSQPSSPLPAMQSELKRSFEALKNADPPAYFIAYRLNDYEDMSAQAEDGSLVRVVPYSHCRYASVQVRVGDYELDNSHPLVESLGLGSNDSAINALGAFGTISFDNDKGLKAAYWLETEKEYREAANRYGRIIGQQGLKSEEDVCADMTKEKPYVQVANPAWKEPAGKYFEEFKQTAKELSALFNAYPGVEQSWVQLKLTRSVRYLANSEGTAVDTKESRVAFSAGGSTIANDGEKITLSEVFYFTDPSELAKLRPKFEELIKQTASSVVALRKAPLADPYCGPVVLRGPAAAVLFHEVLGHRLEASRHKDSSDGKTFAKMVGQNILPPFLSVYDKPTVATINDVELNGHYAVDDDGVPAQDVTLIKNGKLVSFLMGREPIPTCSKSNGHGRCSDTSSLEPVSRMANLIVESSKTASEDELRQHLIAEVKKQGKQYGLIIEQVTGGETNTSSYQPQVFQVRPSLVRRVYVDGRPDDLIRGVRVIGTPMQAVQRIIETSDHTAVFNGYCGAESGWVAQANCCPSLLLDSLEIERETPDKGIARVLPPPESEATMYAKSEDALVNAGKKKQ